MQLVSCFVFVSFADASPGRLVCTSAFIPSHALYDVNGRVLPQFAPLPKPPPDFPLSKAMPARAHTALQAGHKPPANGAAGW